MFNKLKTWWAHEKATSFTTELITSFALVILAVLVIALIGRAGHMAGTKAFGTLSVAIGGPAAINLAAALIRFFDFRDWKKTHHGKKATKEQYKKSKVRQSMDEEERWNSMHQPRH